MVKLIFGAALLSATAGLVVGDIPGIAINICGGDHDGGGGGHHPHRR